ncbi:MAG: tetratricopeptide repeat protein [Acidobacteria bacterium]|nr:tetratricopeptide repeat protein [Acidobacteriota bacterium]
MAKLRRTTGRPATARKKAAAKPAKEAKPAVKTTRKKPTARPRPAPHVKARAEPTTRLAVHNSSRHKQKPVASKPAHRHAVPAKAVTSPKPPARSTYAEAVLTYERAMQALQAKRYRDAAQLLKTVIVTYPEEKELLERAQLYLRVCQRHLAPPDATPSTPEERVYAATLAINTGDIERAVTLLTSALTQDPANDRAEYMLGVALAIRGNAEAAIPHLERAVALNPETRNLIAKEADLEALRHTDAIVALLSAPLPPVFPRKDRERRPARRPPGLPR